MACVTYPPEAAPEARTRHGDPVTVRAMTHLPLRALIPLLVLVLAACNGPQQKMDDAMRAYNADDFAKAFSQASAAQSEAQPPLKQQAALYAGMAAYRQKDMAEARTRLQVAETSDDKQVAGQAKFVLANVLSDEKSYEAAAAKYDEAATLLTGEEATRARALADTARAEAKPAPTQVAAADDTDDAAPAAKGAAKSKSGKAKTDAKGSKGDAKSGDKDGDKSKSADAKSKDKSKSDGDAKKGFTIQCGAYAKESDARKRAKDLTDEAKKAGLPAPEVKRQTGRDGKKLWLVTIGTFKTRAEGKKALAKLEKQKVDHAEVLPITG